MSEDKNEQIDNNNTPAIALFGDTPASKETPTTINEEFNTVIEILLSRRDALNGYLKRSSEFLSIALDDLKRIEDKVAKEKNEIDNILDKEKTLDDLLQFLISNRGSDQKLHLLYQYLSQQYGSKNN